MPLFEDTEEAFVRLLCTKVKPAHFHANEYIVRTGDIDEKMYIIRKGMVSDVSCLVGIRREMSGAPCLALAIERTLKLLTPGEKSSTGTVKPP